MTRYRPHLFATAACLLVAVPFVVRWAMTPAPGVTLENFRRLYAGMTIAEVEQTIGRRCDRFQSIDLPVKRNYYSWSGDSTLPFLEIAEIPGDEGIYSGRFVQGSDDVTLLAVRESLSGKIRRWLGL